MSEDVARVLGASGTDVLTIAGKVCQTRPLSIKELVEVERECLKCYKSEYLRTYHESLQFFDKDRREQLMLEKVEQAARWDVASLPKKELYDLSRTTIKKPLEDWLFEKYGQKVETIDIKAKDRLLRRLAATSLESGTLKDEEFKKLNGELPRKVFGGYVNWWITASFEGMITFVWVAFKEFGITRDDIASELGRNPALMIHLSREIEALSTPELGNT